MMTAKAGRTGPSQGQMCDVVGLVMVVAFVFVFTIEILIWVPSIVAGYRLFQFSQLQRPAHGQSFIHHQPPRKGKVSNRKRVGFGLPRMPDKNITSSVMSSGGNVAALVTKPTTTTSSIALAPLLITTNVTLNTALIPLSNSSSSSSFTTTFPHISRSSVGTVHNTSHFTSSSARISTTRQAATVTTPMPAAHPKTAPFVPTPKAPPASSTKANTLPTSSPKIKGTPAPSVKVKPPPGSVPKVKAKAPPASSPKAEAAAHVIGTGDVAKRPDCKRVAKQLPWSRASQHVAFVLRGESFRYKIEHDLTSYIKKANLTFSSKQQRFKQFGMFKRLTCSPGTYASQQSLARTHLELAAGFRRSGFEVDLFGITYPCLGPPGLNENYTIEKVLPKFYKQPFIAFKMLERDDRATQALAIVEGIRMALQYSEKEGFAYDYLIVLRWDYIYPVDFGSKRMQCYLQTNGFPWAQDARDLWDKHFYKFGGGPNPDSLLLIPRRLLPCFLDWLDGKEAISHAQCPRQNTPAGLPIGYFDPSLGGSRCNLGCCEVPPMLSPKQGCRSAACLQCVHNFAWAMYHVAVANYEKAHTVCRQFKPRRKNRRQLGKGIDWLPKNDKDCLKVSGYKPMR